MILECSRCNATVDAKEMANYQGTEYENEVPAFPLLYTLLSCPSCEGPFLVVQSGDWAYAGADLRWAGKEVLYPQPYRRVDPSFPDNIRRPYEEAIGCWKVGAYTACALMCRKTMEALCAEHEVKARNLAAALEDLRDADVIDDRLFAWADELRLAGNEAAHDVSLTVSRQDAKDIIDFAHALLEYTFTFRDKFKEFMDRRKRAMASNAGGDQHKG